MRKSKAVRATYELAAPPAVGGAELERWLGLAGEELVQQGVIRIAGAAAVCVRVGPGDGVVDLIELDRHLRRLLAARGVIAEARSIVDARVLWDATLPAGHVAVQVWRSTPPESRPPLHQRAGVSATQRRLWAERKASQAGHPA